jgi:hypothetical protein
VTASVGACKSSLAVDEFLRNGRGDVEESERTKLPAFSKIWNTFKSEVSVGSILGLNGGKISCVTYFVTGTPQCIKLKLSP